MSAAPKRRFALQHIASGKFMPERKTRSGYARWSPGVRGPDADELPERKLFGSYAEALTAKKRWCKGFYDRDLVRVEMHSPHQVVKTHRGVGRLHDDLCIVELCDKAPPNWLCSRDKGHFGPCAARCVV